MSIPLLLLPPDPRDISPPPEVTIFVVYTLEVRSDMDVYMLGADKCFRKLAQANARVEELSMYNMLLADVQRRKDGVRSDEERRIYVDSDLCDRYMWQARDMPAERARYVAVVTKMKMPGKILTPEAEARKDLLTLRRNRFRGLNAARRDSEALYVTGAKLDIADHVWVVFINEPKAIASIQEILRSGPGPTGSMITPGSRLSASRRTSLPLGRSVSERVRNSVRWSHSTIEPGLPRRLSTAGRRRPRSLAAGAHAFTTDSLATGSAGGDGPRDANRSAPEDSDPTDPLALVTWSVDSVHAGESSAMRRAKKLWAERLEATQGPYRKHENGYGFARFDLRPEAALATDSICAHIRVERLRVGGFDDPLAVAPPLEALGRATVKIPNEKIVEAQNREDINQILRYPYTYEGATAEVDDEIQRVDPAVPAWPSPPPSPEPVQPRAHNLYHSLLAAVKKQWYGS